jgi:hypothetical protein
MPAGLKDVKAMLASAPELQGVDPETAELRRHKLFPIPRDALQERRLASFRAWLVEHGMLSSSDDPAGSWLTSFWYEGRPRTSEELKLDKAVGDACADCRELRTRGSVTTKTDPVFGSHAVFICAKCAPT